ncbi:MAG: hypothetical protein K8R90_06060 [Candidatus Cloacimonetes bacterium]|nr:hypothetical protein [Candidatus Cloacimonadota bacterium]
MQQFRYNDTGQWFKGNLHIHSTLSDGGRTLPELAKLYADAGYDFLTRMDHWVASDAAADTTSYPLLWLDGAELDGHDYAGGYYHVVCLGHFEGISPEMGFVAAIESVRRQGGLLILAHPAWCGNSMDEALRWQFHGVEVYNHICHWLNGKSDSRAYWNAMLLRNSDTLGIGADDAHLRANNQVWNGAWVHVSAPELTREAIMDAIRRGRFYSSQGPDFKSIELVDGHIEVQTSPVRWIRLVGPNMHGRREGRLDSTSIDQASFSVPTTWEYLYLEIEDENGRRAWTNSLFTYSD